VLLLCEINNSKKKMKKNKLFALVNRSKFLFVITAAFICNVSFVNTAKGQVIYTTDFGTVANVNPTSWTFTGAGMNISTNNTSIGYTGASGGACLGEGNSTTFTNTSGAAQLTSPLGVSSAELLVSTTGYSNIALSFGMRKSSAGYNANATYTLEWSTNGVAYNTITYTEAAASSWGLASGAGLLLPAGANNQTSLYFKWTFDRTGTSSNFKIDDVMVSSATSTVAPATIAFLSNDTTVSEGVGSANIYLRLTSTSTASSVITISVSALSNAGALDYAIPALTFTFAANAPVNSTYPVAINLTNDVLIESAEYIILRFASPQNANIGAISQFAFYIADNDKVIPVPSNAIGLNLLSSFSNGVGGTNSSEIVAHDPTTQRLYIANSIGAKLDIVDFVNPSAPALLFSVPITTYGNINSVAVRNGIVAVAIENSTNPQDSGKVVFFNSDGVFVKQVKVGMMPDMITFNNAGTKVLTANEGEPNAAYTNDPDGSVSIIDISGGIATLSQTNVAHVTFTVYNGQETALRAQGIRIYGPGANASKDFEPEYIAISKDDTKAWVTLQENNAVAEINLVTNSVTAIRALGTKDHSLLNNGIDGSNVTKGVNISNFPIKGMYLPDAIATYTVGGVNYIITANEGDSRNYSGFSEEQRISSVNLDATKFPLATQMKNTSVLGRLNVTDKLGDFDLDGDLDTLYSYGSRSFSIWNASTGVQVYDSKDDLEMITSTNSYSVLFNASNTNNTRKDRSDDKGPEPEGVTIGTIGSNTYAFIALERIGGVMVYDVTNPLAPVFVTYANNRSLPSGGPDNGSEGIIFIPQSQSPNGQHIVITANEISSTLSIWGIAGCATPLSSSLSVTGPTTNICSNTTPTLSVPAGSGLTFQWSRNGAPVGGATSNTISAIQSGTYAVVIMGAATCSTTSLPKTYSVNASPTLAITGGTAFCIGSTLSQTISGASTYTWSNGLNGSTTNFTFASSANYSVSGTSTNNCVSSITRIITANPLPTISISGGNATVCQGTPLSLTASGAATYTWNNTVTGASLNIAPQTNSTYVVVGIDLNGCSNNATKQVSVNPLPLITVNNSSTQVCSGQSVILTAAGANSYTWNIPANTAAVTVTPGTNSTYIVSGTGANGCVNSASQTINAIPVPVLNLVSSSSALCKGETATLTISGATSYSWNTGAQTAQIVVSPSITSMYNVTGTGIGNCSSMVQITQTVSECTSIGELKNESSAYLLYPNPAKTTVSLSFEQSNTIEIKIYNALGSLVMNKSNYESKTEINIENLNKGIYFISVLNKGTTILKKLVIE